MQALQVAAGGRLRALRREGVDHRVAEFLQAVDLGQLLANQGHARRLQDALHRIVAADQAEFRIQYHHPGRHIGQHRFQVGLGVLQRSTVLLHRAARVRQLAGHGVERLRQRAQLVRGGDNRPRRQIALGHRARALGQQQQRLGQVAGDQEGAGDGAKHGQQQGQGQRFDIHLAQPDPGHEAFLVFAIRAADDFRIAGQLRRRQLDQLQVARRQVGAVGLHRIGNRDHHPQP